MDDEHDQVDPVLDRAIARLRDSEPATDLWPGIQSRLPMQRHPGVLQVRWPVALAAGAALVAASIAGTAAWMHATRASSAVAAGPDVPGAVTRASASAADEEIERAIVDLETLLRDNITTIGTDTYRSLAKSLAILDQAIADAAAQQRATPDDPDARRYLTSSLQRKLDVLERVTTMTAIRS